MSNIYRAKNQCTTVSCLRICLPFLLSDFGLGAKKKEGREKMLYSSTHFSSKLQIVWQLLIKNFQGREKKLFSDESSFLFPNFSFFGGIYLRCGRKLFFPFFSQRLSEMHSVWKPTEINSIQIKNLVNKKSQMILSDPTLKFGRVKMMLTMVYVYFFDDFETQCFQRWKE